MSHADQKPLTMGKSKKKLDDLKKEKDLKKIKPVDMKKIIGGKKSKKRKANNGCGGILPQ